MSAHPSTPARGDVTLVTGGGGFVGRWLTERLVEAGARVRVLGRRRYPELEARGVECVVGDVADRESVERACRGARDVHHAAACVELWHPREELVRTNVTGTQRLVEACLREGVERLVFTSTASVVFGDDDIEGGDESLPYPSRFSSVYPETKAAAEQIVLEANGRGSLSTAALRPHLVWGPRDSHLVPNLLRLSRSGRLVKVGDGRNLMDVTYVENLVDAHLLTAERLAPGSAAAGRPFFVSQGEPVVAWDFFGSMLERLGAPQPTRTISYRRAWTLGLVLELAWKVLRRRGAPPMTRFLAAQMAHSHYFDIGAARRDLGYQPRVSTEEGVERLVASFSGAAA